MLKWCLVRIIGAIKLGKLNRSIRGNSYFIPRHIIEKALSEG